MSDFKLVRADTVSFLLGEEGDFERVPGEGPFWWRNVLRNGVVGYHEADSEQMDKLTAENQRLQARVAELEKSFKELSDFFNDKIVGEQAAYIEWQHGKGAVAGMHWIANGLCGPGLIPDDDEPWGKEAQAYFNANKSDPFPVCSCGRPSGQLWMGHGACCDEHMAEIKSSDADKAGGDV